MKSDFSIRSCRNILVPRFDTFGDLVLLEGFISALLGLLPEASVTFLVRKGFDQMADMFPERLRWITTSINPYTQSPEPEESGSLLEFIRGQHYDLVLFTAYTRTWLDDLIAGAASDARRVAFCADGAEDRPLHAECCYSLVEVDEKIHETEKYQTYWEQVTGEQSVLPPPQLTLPHEISGRASRVLAERGLLEGEYLLCAPAGTATISIKAWPENCFAALITRIEQIFGVPALIAGHEEEHTIIQNVLRLAEHEGAHPRVWLGMDGEMPIAAALARKSLFYLGNDTGLMHAAAALERPVIALFGGGHWPRFLPVARTGRVFVTPMPCFYCKWECLFSNALCVRGISLEEVFPEIEEFLKDLRNGRQSFRVIEQKVQTADLRDFFEQAVRCLDRMKKDAQAERRSFLKQGAELTRLLQESEKDRNARLEQITELTRLLLESEKDRNARLEQITELEHLLLESENKRYALTQLLEIARGAISGIESSRIYRLARAMGFYDDLERLIADFQGRTD